VRLPTEMQWQQAATGGDAGNRWPWSKEFRSGYANIDETSGKTGPHYLEQTSAVGLYPLGASLEGVLDLAGNVWEWCLNKYDEPDDVSTEGEDLRSLRGGSWYDLQDHVRPGPLP